MLCLICNKNATEQEYPVDYPDIAFIYASKVGANDTEQCSGMALFDNEPFYFVLSFLRQFSFCCCFYMAIALEYKLDQTIHSAFRKHIQPISGPFKAL